MITAGRDGGLAAFRPVEMPPRQIFHAASGSSVANASWLPHPQGDRIILRAWHRLTLVDPDTGLEQEVTREDGVNWTSSVAAPNGRRLFAGTGLPGRAVAWEMHDETPRPLWEWRPDVACEVIVSAVPADGAWVAAWLETADDGEFSDGTQHALIRLDAETGSVLARRGLSARSCPPATRRDGSLIAAGLHEKVLLLDPLTLETRAELDGHSESVSLLAFTPDGRYLASASDDRVILWDVEKRRAVRSWRSDVGSVSTVDFSPNGRLLVTSTREHAPRIWDVETGRLLLEPELTPATAIKEPIDWRPAFFSPDGTRLVVGSGRRVEIIDGRLLE